jgi:selT/selW/selH-like putative selenoprotein
MADNAIDRVSLPRVAITYCTQCKWMLRAAYFGQELLSTFGTTIGEIALIPATGGLFTVTLSYIPQPIGEQRDGNKDSMQPQTVLLWDRKAEGGFPGVSPSQVECSQLPSPASPSSDQLHFPNCTSPIALPILFESQFETSSMLTTHMQKPKSLSNAFGTA